jgi:hypothetical protein
MIYKFGFLILAIAASTFTDAVVDEVALMACVETVDWCDVCASFGDASLRHEGSISFLRLRL